MAKLIRICSKNTGLLCLIVATMGCAASVAQSSANRSSALYPDRISAGIDESEWVSPGGNVHPQARPAFDRCVVAPGTRLEKLVLVLSPSGRQQGDLDRLTQQQQTPGSPQYHHWLTPEEYGIRFGVSHSDLEQITAWLERKGFTVDEVPASQRLIVFSGTAGQVANAFHTELHRYAVATGAGGTELHTGMHMANASNLQIPAALAGVVHGILSLHDFRRSSAISSRRPVDRAGAGAEYTSGSGISYLAPADFATIYDVNPLYAAGTTGTGATIAIVSRSNISLADVASFRSFAQLPVKAPTVTLVGANPGLVPGDEDEAILDVEWSGAVGQGATVNMVVAASTATTDGVDLSAQYIVNHASGQVMSISFGSCELYMGSSEMAFYNSLWQQAASEGISVFVSSGDSGAAGCEGGNATTGSMRAVNGLCSSPYSTCVGGTEFNEGSNLGQYWSSTNKANGGTALSYIPERVWNDSALNAGSGLWSSGGGASITYVQPSWQQGVSGTSATGGMRGVPDVSLAASGAHDGYLMEENGSLYVIGGTSASSPSFAGLMSLVVQAEGGTGQGNANPTLYGLVNASTNPFHATPTGNNSVPGVAGFVSLGAAYNLATGLGSVDAFVLANEWSHGPVSGGGAATADFTLSLSATSGSLLVGKSARFTISAVAVGKAQPKVSLSVSAPSGIGVVLKPFVLTAGTSSTGTITVGTGAMSGPQTVVITGTDASGSVTASYSLVVIPLPTLTLTTSLPTTSIVRGKSVTVGVNVIGGGSFTGTVNLAVAGLPTGVTALWGLNGIVVPSGASTINVPLTLTATTAARVTSSAILLTATGDGLSAVAHLSVQVLQAPGILVSVPSALTLQSMGSASLTVTATPLGTATIPVSGAGASVLLTSFLPSGISSSWSGPTFSSSRAVSWTLTLTGGVNAVASTPTLQFAIQVQDQTTAAIYNGTASSKLIVQLTRPTLTMTAVASSVSVVQGASTTSTFTLTGGGSFHGAINLSVAGLPAGASAIWATNPLTLNSNSATATLTIQASSIAKVSSSVATVTATGDGLSVGIRLPVQITYAPAVQISLTPSALTMSHAATASGTVIVTPVGGLSAAATLSLGSLPKGITATLGTGNLLSPGNGSTTLIFHGSSSAIPGTYNIQVMANLSGNGTTYTATTTMKLNVTK